VGRRFAGYYQQLLAAVLEYYGESISTPGRIFPPLFSGRCSTAAVRKWIDFMLMGEGSEYNYRRPFEGVMPTWRAFSRNGKRLCAHRNGQIPAPNTVRYLSRHPPAPEARSVSLGKFPYTN